MRAVGYLRARADDQQRVMCRLDEQRREIDVWALEHGYEIVAWFADVNSSANDAMRPAFKALITLAAEEPRTFSAVLATSGTRWSREYSLFEQTYKSLHDVGISLLFTQQQRSPNDFAETLDRITKFFGESPRRGRKKIVNSSRQR
jgi:DNA invertase Pin-like site-specific DNA recombinase